MTKTLALEEILQLKSKNEELIEYIENRKQKELYKGQCIPIYSIDGYDFHTVIYKKIQEIDVLINKIYKNIE